ncbi:hypothetical protein [Nocardioides pantholopis]|uniref:hypothetical protein n=1 Tax=Nocardioides pantholopis TaxID=2483798 RepID=UPI0019D2EEFB|nr:hypothetical protein [Nocardioides pantholopis]
MIPRLRRTPAPFAVGPGERLLAWAVSDRGPVGGTRDALYVPDGDATIRIPWEQVESAEWDKETEALCVLEVGTWGEQRPRHVLVLTEPGRVLELVRERVTASVVLQRHVPVAGGGVRVIARRAPGGHRPVAWFYEYDEGVDPDRPEVRAAARAALDEARADLGLA